MQRRIVGFHQDEEQHWVADLECGHGQHVRHDPPWQRRPWVLTEESRANFIGIELNCAKCDVAQTPGIEIVPYDPRWPAAFEAEALRIRQALGAIARRVDHHGSTAVPGLAAKPIIDIQVSVATLQPLSEYGAPLESIGYLHVPHADDAFCPFFHRPSRWPHTHHVHVVASGSGEERRTLAFRDYLRDHVDAARAYEQLKRQLAARLVGGDAESREAYARAKGQMVEEIAADALSRGYPRETL